MSYEDMSDSAIAESRLAMCEGKQRHNRATANRIVRETTKIKLDAFHCRHCDGWHVGATPPRNVRLRKK